MNGWTANAPTVAGSATTPELVTFSSCGSKNSGKPEVKFNLPSANSCPIHLGILWSYSRIHQLSSNPSTVSTKQQQTERMLRRSLMCMPQENTQPLQNHQLMKNNTKGHFCYFVEAFGIYILYLCGIFISWYVKELIGLQSHWFDIYCSCTYIKYRAHQVIGKSSRALCNDFPLHICQ